MNRDFIFPMDNIKEIRMDVNPSSGFYHVIIKIVDVVDNYVFELC